jgi:N-carbamoyl-L-amino-acid hydrolase
VYVPVLTPESSCGAPAAARASQLPPSHPHTPPRDGCVVPGGTMPSVNAERLLQDMRELRTFGAAASHDLGVVRPSLSAPDLASRHWLRDKLAEAGLDACIDGVGVVFGRSRNPGPALLVGSHSDTQPRGGWLDGAMGVVYGLECARALAEDPATAHLAVDVASWTDEEATYFGMLGSKSFCGLLDAAAAAQAHSAGVMSEDGGVVIPAGDTLADALARAGLSARPRVQMVPGRYLGFFEAHIEQGPRLEQAGKRIGVVTGCVGIDGAVMKFTGQQNHAGTTPMEARADAGMVAIRLAAEIDECFQRIKSPVSVWTFGALTVGPGAASIVPGTASLTLQFRDPSAQQQALFRREVQRLVTATMADTGRHGVTIDIDWRSGYSNPLDSTNANSSDGVAEQELLTAQCGGLPPAPMDTHLTQGVRARQSWDWLACVACTQAQCPDTTPSSKR